ncbi:MAG: hypothetical protein WHT27_07485, partial [candidate division WOR-3 bacterium]
MKRVVLFFVIFFVGVMLFGNLREDYLKLIVMETMEKQPKFATDSINVRGVGRFPAFGYAYDVFVVDTLAYVCMGNNLVILNISNKAAPKLLGYIDLPDYAEGVYVSGSYAYVADGYSGLRIINISNPSNPYEVSHYNTPEEIQDIYVSGSYAYVACRYFFYSSSLRIINISNPKNPYQVGYYDTPGEAEGVYVSGSYIYLVYGSDGFYVLQQ